MAYWLILTVALYRHKFYGRFLMYKCTLHWLKRYSKITYIITPSRKNRIIKCNMGFTLGINYYGIDNHDNFTPNKN